MSKKIPPERVEQRNFVKWIKQKYTLDVQFIEIAHIPNGGYRNKMEAAALKADGVNAGAPDLFIPISDGKTVWIEMKRIEDYSISKSQKKWKNILTLLSHYYILAEGCEDAIKQVEELFDRIGEREKWKKLKLE
jgi:hypothetical protein